METVKFNKYHGSVPTLSTNTLKSFVRKLKKGDLHEDRQVGLFFQHVDDEHVLILDPDFPPVRCILEHGWRCEYDISFPHGVRFQKQDVTLSVDELLQHASFQGQLPINSLTNAYMWLATVESDYHAKVPTEEIQKAVEVEVARQMVAVGAVEQPVVITPTPSASYTKLICNASVPLETNKHTRIPFETVADKKGDIKAEKHTKDGIICLSKVGLYYINASIGISGSAKKEGILIYMSVYMNGKIHTQDMRYYHQYGGSIVASISLMLHVKESDINSKRCRVEVIGCHNGVEPRELISAPEATQCTICFLG